MCDSEFSTHPEWTAEQLEAATGIPTSLEDLYVMAWRSLCVERAVQVHDADLAQCMLYTSGRVPSDMASKAIRAGIPVLVSKSVATDQGIALARAYGLTLICEARPMQFDIVNG